SAILLATRDRPPRSRSNGAALLKSWQADLGPDSTREGHKYPAARRLPSMAKAKPRSWWRMRQIRRRDAGVLSVLAASFLLAGELANQDIQYVYETYIIRSGALGNVGLLLLVVGLIV